MENSNTFTNTVRMYLLFSDHVTKTIKNFKKLKKKFKWCLKCDVQGKYSEVQGSLSASTGFF